MSRKLKLLLVCLLGLGWLFVLKSYQDVNDLTAQVLALVEKNITDSWINTQEKLKEIREITNGPMSSQNPNEEELNIPYETRNETSEPKVKFVLLLSSVGRSGSSFLGELIASQEHNIYLYEPIRALPRMLQKKGTILDELWRNFHCQQTSEFLDIGKTPYVSVKHPYVFDKKRSEIKMSKLRSVCLQEKLRIIKTIRTRLEWTKKFLENDSLDFKVLHLVRDPRGSYVSSSELEWKMIGEDMCQKIMEDLQEREEMEKLFPSKYYFITYEDLCINPFEKSQEIFRFLEGKDVRSFRDQDQPMHTKKKHTSPSPDQYPDLPSKVFSYLKSHIHVSFLSKKSPWTTQRDSSSHYQKWRKKITRRELLDVENHCGDVLRILGHRAFGTLEMARNLSVSLFV